MSMRVAAIFPGQGAQQVGMGKALAEKSVRARHLFQEADDALGFSLTQLMFAGPQEKLTLTYHAQPAILAVSYALYLEWQEYGITPAAVAGHSLGEYTALVASGALSFTDAIRLVHQRGLYMEEAVPVGLGSMAAVIGLDGSEVEAMCQAFSQKEKVVEAANFNSPGQVVLSGHRMAVEAMGVQMKEQGARRVLPLDVSGPFHSSLMKPAADKLEASLEQVSLSELTIPVISNVTARPHKNEASSIKHLLVEQVTSPVRWEESVSYMASEGINAFVELGPGKVLTGLVKRTARGADAFSVQDPSSLEQAQAWSSSTQTGG
ncbi:ACP S-malonyltransferase [Mechercharimyces sp. CAU 1602]|uniref:ACP S-malonyltransferase n=1 Tax=Mechercharimyces sp. CAU 1602 TaxID=2973933 RepID=UPI002162B818|nr:ACP S-malonyltransferase [Mechercharimyces sp. CAU 1602]MCS1351365.1 ACP S-malonyltransferase [Mechercharimyces sp. CAU 1602]